MTDSPLSGALKSGEAFTNEELFARGQNVIPGGVNSPVRAFRSVGGTPYFVTKGQGARVFDVEGNSFLDLVQSYGAIIAGHAHPHIIDAIRSAALDGTSFGAPTPREVLLAEEISRRVPSCQKIRMVNSGTEATMSVIRVARGATGRDRILKFAGNYHGHSDGLLVSGGTAMASLGIPASAGVTANAIADTVVAPYNVVPELDETFAAVIVEPCAANMGLVLPAPGFLEGLRAECDRVGALLIFDEVITGFRVGRGGAQQRLGVAPDLTAFGKIIGGGLPVGAFGGRAELMDNLAPLGPVYQAGTLSGNPLATAAGLATLELLDDAAYELIETRADCLAGAFANAFTAVGIDVKVPRFGTLIGLYFGDTTPTDYESACRTNETMYASFFHALLARGVAIAPGAYEVMFPGLAHDDEVLEAIADAAALAAAHVAEAR